MLIDIKMKGTKLLSASKDFCVRALLPNEATKIGQYLPVQ